MTQIKTATGGTVKAINTYSTSWLMNKVGKVFRGGLWEDAISYMTKLYESGVEYVPFVNGLMSAGYSTSSKQTTYLNLEVWRESGSWKQATFVTDNMIDISSLNTIYMEFTKDSTLTSEVALVASTDKLGGHSTYNAQALSKSREAKTILPLDVSQLTGMYYIRFHVHTGSGTGGWVQAFRIWGE
jgi:hypothetical protein